MNDRSFTDSQVFFAAVVGLAAVLVGHSLLVDLVTASATQTDRLAHAPTLISRVAPASTILPFSAFFVFLPAGLAFLGIGVPFALRSVVAVIRRQSSRVEVLGLAALLLCGLLVISELSNGGSGVVAVATTAAVGLWQCGGPLGRGGAAFYSWRLLALGGASLVGLAYYEYVYLATGELSVAVAPTLLVVGFFSLVAALVLMGAAAAVAGQRETRAAVALGWLLAGVWYLAPGLRGLLASPETADRLELWVTVLVGVSLAGLGLYHSRRR